jgi:DNA-binding SARP family transcriptional activator
MRVHIQLLGKFQVTLDERVVAADAWRREKAAALVKRLALAPNHRLHREQVFELFWPDLDVEAAGANLRKAVHFARRTLGEHDLIELSGEVVALAPNAELALDTDEFEAAAKTALRTADPKDCERAAEAYGGELLPDDRYVDWLDEPREQLRDRYARVLGAGKLWERLVALDPTDETAQCALMQAALDAGNRNEVIRIFGRLRERLRVDLGVGPKAASIAIYERALATRAAAPESLVDKVRASLAWGLVHLQSGDLTKAASIARETRDLALSAELGREVGEASALLGLTAHVQGRWLELFRSEFTEWVRLAPSFASNVFDGHMCLAQFCLCGAGGHEETRKAASELLTVAEQEKSAAGRALALGCLGEAALFSGFVDEAERLLVEAERLHLETGSAAGRAIALERLAQIALARGQKWKAGRTVQRAAGIAETSWLRPHLLIRLKALEVQTASTAEQTAQAILEGDRSLADAGSCQPCSIGFRTAAAIALAEAGELDQVGRRLDEAERLAGMWSGGPWVAAVWEARGVQRRAQGQEDRALAAFDEASTRFIELGRPLDQARCQARMKATASTS